MVKVKVLEGLEKIDVVGRSFGVLLMVGDYIYGVEGNYCDAIIG